jgi:hypothetical protein
VIRSKENQITDLKETLSVPRQHYRYIERLTAEQIVEQKNEILKKLSAELGV